MPCVCVCMHLKAIITPPRRPLFTTFVDTLDVALDSVLFSNAEPSSAVNADEGGRVDAPVLAPLSPGDAEQVKEGRASSDGPGVRGVVNSGPSTIAAKGNTIKSLTTNAPSPAATVDADGKAHMTTTVAGCTAAAADLDGELCQRQTFLTQQSQSQSQPKTGDSVVEAQAVETQKEKRSVLCDIHLQDSNAAKWYTLKTPRKAMPIPSIMRPRTTAVYPSSARAVQKSDAQG